MSQLNYLEFNPNDIKVDVLMKNFISVTHIPSGYRVAIQRDNQIEAFNIAIKKLRDNLKDDKELDNTSFEVYDENFYE